MQVVPPDLPSGVKEHILVVHDESTFYSNDDERKQWVEQGRGFSLKRKNAGGSVNSSKFLSEKIGRVRMTDEQYTRYKQAHPDSNLPQDSGVEMKCGTKYATAITGKTVLGLVHKGSLPHFD